MDEVTESKFPFQVTVTYVFTTDNNLHGYTPPPQPILLSVPYDVFYPFNMNSASSLGSSSLSVVYVISLCVTVLYLALFVVS